MIKLFLQSFLITLAIGVTYAQDDFSVLLDFRDYNLLKNQSKLLTYDDFEKKMVSWRYNLYENYNIFDDSFSMIEDVSEKDISEAKTQGKFLYHLNLADYYFYKYPNKIIEARYQYIEALTLAKEKESPILICTALRKILELHRSDYLFDNTTAHGYLEQLDENAFDKIEEMYLSYYSLILNFQYYNLDAWNTQEADKLLNFANNSNHYHLNTIIYQLISSYYDTINNKSLAINYSNRALVEASKIGFSSNF